MGKASPDLGLTIVTKYNRNNEFCMDDPPYIVKENPGFCMSLFKRHVDGILPEV